MFAFATHCPLGDYARRPWQSSALDTLSRLASIPRRRQIDRAASRLYSRTAYGLGRRVKMTRVRVDSRANQHVLTPLTGSGEIDVKSTEEVSARAGSPFRTLHMPRRGATPASERGRLILRYAKIRKTGQHFRLWELGSDDGVRARADAKLRRPVFRTNLVLRQRHRDRHGRITLLPGPTGWPSRALEYQVPNDWQSRSFADGRRALARHQPVRSLSPRRKGWW